MKEYVKPEIVEEKIIIEDIIAASNLKLFQSFKSDSEDNYYSNSFWN